MRVTLSASSILTVTRGAGPETDEGTDEGTVNLCDLLLSTVVRAAEGEGGEGSDACL